ncbi:hypothetical protein DICPUDRAFT_152793 [Dictyostelium purpureum]|uniref:Uncharacterized protein n=1 Tax=Dictyostelium purpureum TaxID=5786 RepID=F0ZMA4_DICPU|nr:uncharacterized protein DICPUDRAFT_152793 [Dictyostelium purpureum]EGC34924.1 hypothetical protein DICPUDRAFT_152793 [Dictyostelium purpureum]|eukprot:XP_003288557.1 hypothetical protein DICPUDRAFT_152793 [Dictyostelium purpureum]
MVQSFNFEAIKCLKHVYRNKSLIVPHLEFKDIRGIDFKQLHDKGFKGVLFDKDNTLTEPYADTIYNPFKESIEKCKEIFGEENIAIISNSAGSSDDYPDYEKADHIEKNLGIKVLKHNTKKPDGIDSVTNHFKTDPSNLVMVGDRYLTDILFGNLYGMFTIYTNPITSKGDNFFVKLIRDKERNYVLNLKETENIKAPINKIWDK